MAKYLVTGGAGFIGSHLASALLAGGETVRVLDNFATGRRENLEFLRGAEIVEGDIRSYHIVRDAVQGMDYVLHLAALPSVPRSVRDPITSNEVNVVGTLNVLTAARDAKVRRLVYASSSSVYGSNRELPKREDMEPRPISPYAVSKLAGEYYCRSFADIYGFETVVLRYFNVFGPRQSARSEYAAVIPRFIQALLDGQAPTVFGDGSQTRDFTFVDNVVTANLRACESAGAVGRVFNVAAGQQISLLDLLEALQRVTGKRVAPKFVAPRLGEVKHSSASVDRAREVLGYRPEVGFQEGLRRTVEAVARDSGSRQP